MTFSKAWVDIFGELDQWDDVEKFYGFHARTRLNTVQGHRRLCSPRIGYLAAQKSGTVQLIDHLYQEVGDNLQTEAPSEIRSLMGAGATASTVVTGNVFE